MKKSLNYLRGNGVTKFNISKFLYQLTHIRKWHQGRKYIYLVYTPGKVGSQSIYLTLRRHLMESNVFHTHFLSRKWLDQYDFKGSEKARTVQRVKRIYALLKSDTNLRIVCVVREPVAKTISQLFQTPEAFGISESALLTANPVEISDILKKKKWQFHHVLNWFDTEFIDFTGINIYQSSFDCVEKKQVIEFEKKMF